MDEKAHTEAPLAKHYDHLVHNAWVGGAFEQKEAQQQREAR